MTASYLPIEREYVDLVYNFHQIMIDNELSLVYEGEINQSITMAFTSLAEQNMEEIEEPKYTKTKVYHVMVECLQNICKHADDIFTGEKTNHGRGIFLVGTTDTEYIITTANPVNKKRIPKLQTWIDEINGLEHEDVRKLYRKSLKENKITPEGGAGLGLIDIVRKTGNPLEYHFESINDHTSYFMLRTRVLRGAAALVEKQNSN